MSLIRQNHRANVAQNRVLTQEQVQAVFDLYPPGIRFRPRDEELVVFYLRKKLLDQPLPLNMIKEVELYAHHPQELVGSGSLGGNDQASHALAQPFNNLKRLRLDDVSKSKLDDDSPKLKLDESDDQYANGVASITPKYPNYYNEVICDQSSSSFVGNNLHDPYDDYNMNFMADPSFDGLGFLNQEFHGHHYY
ncbi:No apical meristem (NAM) protein [Corchorus capsularis]|uniref:No apical meristem (NAM) protein n=1 Tax=Corchorus capsularis TaxID=210143 RepID=A0A1R3GGH4_COCAP|nr:No apical meristem (NAM) protein [Corchorus capsularis]